MISFSDILSNPIYATIVIGIIVGIGVVLTLKNRRYPYYACDTLLTPAELKFYKILKSTIPTNTLICMKVRMADLINCEERHWQSGWGPRISAKHIDFVLIDAQTTQIKLAIELDDSSHRTDRNRIDRDKFVNKAFDVAGVRLLRVPVQKFYNESDLKKLLA